MPSRGPINMECWGSWRGVQGGWGWWQEVGGRAGAGLGNSFPPFWLRPFWGGERGQEVVLLVLIQLLLLSLLLHPLLAPPYTPSPMPSPHTPWGLVPVWR